MDRHVDRPSVIKRTKQFCLFQSGEVLWNTALSAIRNKNIRKIGIFMFFSIELMINTEEGKYK